VYSTHRHQRHDGASAFTGGQGHSRASRGLREIPEGTLALRALLVTLPVALVAPGVQSGVGP
jgi:hypothetical protein